MITISLCMIVKNEEMILSRCLDSIKDAVDEIVIVDTGSSDRTKEIAATYTDKVFSFAWIQDFSAARNFAYSKATMDYQMWLDADDVFPEDSRKKLLVLKETLPQDVDMVTMRYHTHFDEQENPILTSTRERLTRRKKGFRWLDPVHECIPLSGKIFYSDITIWHKKPPSTEVSTRNLTIYQALEESGHTFTPRQQYYFARELKDHGNFERSAKYFQAFLDGGLGWIEDNISSCLNLARCHQALGQEEACLSSLLRSFRYDAPRPEACCELGYYNTRQGNYAAALSWFLTAITLPKFSELGFVLSDYGEFIPNIEACVCCYALGDYQRAWDYNEQAAQYKPNHPAIVQNRRVLREKLDSHSISAV